MIINLRNEQIQQGPPKIIIVEGKTDRDKLLQVLNEPVEIICTYGTLSDDKIEEFLWPLQDEEVSVLVDADDAGNKLRKEIKRELPHARQLYTRRMYGEVATTPVEHLAKILADAHFEVHEHYLEMGSEM